MTIEQFQRAEVIKENLQMIEQAKDFLRTYEREQKEYTRLMTFNSKNYVEALAGGDEEFKKDVLEALDRLKGRMSAEFERL